MIQFTTAAIICTVFLILGAVISGAGAAHGLGALGKLNALPGAFMARVLRRVDGLLDDQGGTSGLHHLGDRRGNYRLEPVQRLYNDTSALSKIFATWVACPILGAIFGALIYKAVMLILSRSRIHLLRLDGYTRLGLILAGAFGSTALVRTTSAMSWACSSPPIRSPISASAICLP